MLPYPLILLTDRRQARRPLVEVIAAAVQGGVRLVVLREKDLPPDERASLADRVARLLRPVRGQLVMASTGVGSPPAATGGPQQHRSQQHRSQQCGLHLTATDPWPRQRESPLGRSCHSLAEVADAATAGADYATLSPIFPSLSKPGYGPPLGLDILGARTLIPVYALGGVDTPQRVRRCVKAGAAGVAVMGAIMRAADPGTRTAELLAAARQ